MGPELHNTEVRQARGRTRLGWRSGPQQIFPAKYSRACCCLFCLRLMLEARFFRFRVDRFMAFIRYATRARYARR